MAARYQCKGLPLRLPAEVQFLTLRGYLPVRLCNEETGFECFHDDAGETMRFLGMINFDHRWRFALGLRWIGDIAELQAAWMAATAYAALTGGVVFDHHEGRVFLPQQAEEVVRNIVRDVPAMQATLEEIKRKFSS